MAGVDADSLHAAAQRKLEGKPPSRPASSVTDEEEFRRSEYQTICDGKVGPKTEPFVECANRATYDPEVAKFFSKIRFVHRLRETQIELA